MPMKVVLLGPPGVGKGTAAKMLAEKYGIPHISTGSIFREEIGKQSELGKKAHEYVEAGLLVPDELVTEMVKARLEQEDASRGYILDGYPRTLEQAKALKKFAEIDHVLNLSAPKKTIIDRIKGRSEGRADDSPEIIMQRIAEYEEKTTPLIDFYRNEEILGDIDSTQDVEGVTKQCAEVLGDVHD